MKDAYDLYEVPERLNNYVIQESKPSRNHESCRVILGRKSRTEYVTAIYRAGRSWSWGNYFDNAKDATSDYDRRD